MRDTVWVYVSQNERCLKMRTGVKGGVMEIDGRRKREWIKVLLDREIV